MGWHERIRSEGCDAERALVSALALTTALLRIAAANVASVRVELVDASNSVERDRVSEALHAVLRTLGDVPRSYLRGRFVSSLLDVLAGSRLEPCLLGLLAARALDARLGLESSRRPRPASSACPGDYKAL